MATAESVKAKIQSLIAKANTATGRADEDMTSAVNALVSGYGGGSSGGGVETCTVTFNDQTLVGAYFYYISVSDGMFKIVYDSSGMIDSIVVPTNSNIIFTDTDTLDLSVESIDGSSYYNPFTGVFIGTSDTIITITNNSGNDNPWG